jgi:hypothetical protein
MGQGGGLYLKHISVTYRDSQTYDSSFLKEETGQSNDINEGHGGKYVYLVPETTDNPDEALTDLSIWITDSVDNTRDDVSKGAGGQYRYIIETRNNDPNKILASSLTLRRSSGSLDPKPSYRQTIDINKGRGKDYLYLSFQTILLTSSPSYAPTLKPTTTSPSYAPTAAPTTTSPSYAPTSKPTFEACLPGFYTCKGGTCCDRDIDCSCDQICNIPPGLKPGVCSYKVSSVCSPGYNVCQGGTCCDVNEDCSCDQICKTVPYGLKVCSYQIK